MKTNQIFVVVCVAVAGFVFWHALFGRAGWSPDFQDDYEATLVKAMDQKKPLVVKFYADWCPPCKEMDKNVLPSQEVRAVADRALWVKVDVDQQGKLADDFGVQSIPTTLIIDPKGNIIHRLVGPPSPTELAEKILSVAGS
ncbi:MAG: thioredoxin family protein [Armatimonadetes bacterium]|nr:thioredoxin family protein [Armatimonadota bacterium]